MDEPAAAQPSDLYARPASDDPSVRAILARLGEVGAPMDLGGTMSLNLHLETRGLVLRIHGRFERLERVKALRALRRNLDAHGVVVGVPQLLMGEEIVDIGGRLAEVETYVQSAKPDPSWHSYLWMYRAMGTLHRAVNEGRPVTLPAPGVATYAAPGDLRRWIGATAAAVRGDEHALAMAERVAGMVDELEKQWTDPAVLPTQLVHGDIRLGNVNKSVSGEPVFYDFGFAARRPRIHELAYSLFWIVLKPDDSGRAEDFDWVRVAELIDAYEAAAGVTLLEAERRAIGPYLAAVPMYFAAIASYTPEPCDRIKQEARSLEIARWVLDHPVELQT